MKKKITDLKSYKATDLRKQWKKEAEDEIITLQEDIDMMELPEDKAKELEALIQNFKQRLDSTISLFEITTEIAIDEDCLLENMLDEVYYGRAIANETEIERMIDLTSEKGVFIKINSLAERIKVEEFIEELTVNPYQLKLIA